jgi:hypothetical protein
MKKHLGQRIALAMAILCYIAAGASALAVFLYQSAVPSDPVRASLIAMVVFFVGCGVVLHVIGRSRLKGVLSGSGDIED